MLDLNKKITNFLHAHAVPYNKKLWLFIFRDGGMWSEEHQGYYRQKEDGGYEWYEE